MSWVKSFLIRGNKIQVLLPYLIFSLFLLALPNSYKSQISHLIFTFVYSPFYQLNSKLKQLYKVSQENKRLSEALNQLKLEILKAKEESLENIRLRELFGFKSRLEYRVIPAEVVALEPNRKSYTVMLDIGEKDGVKKNFPVINMKGLVGKVTEVKKGSCWVELLLHPNCRVAALDRRSRVHGIIRGSEGNLLKLDNVPLEEDVKVDDEIISSGLGGIFPAGLEIGKVKKVREEKEGNFFKSILVKSGVDFNQLEELFVLESEKRD